MRLHTYGGGTVRQPLQLQHQIVGALPSVIGIFRYAQREELIELRRSNGLDTGCRLRLLADDSGDKARLALAFEGLFACDHFVQNSAKSKDIRTRIGLMSFE